MISFKIACDFTQILKEIRVKNVRKYGILAFFLYLLLPFHHIIAAEYTSMLAAMRHEAACVDPCDSG